MIGRVSVELPTPTYIALLQQLRQSSSAADPALALTAAVEFWLAEQRRLTGAAPAPAHPVMPGTTSLSACRVRAISHSQPS